MGDITDNRYLETLYAALVIAHGQQVKQCLAGVLVGTIAGIDN
jgi:hypothetical protein